jgi:hypothetical protein
MVDEHLQEEHPAPLRTTPQGTQSVAVTPGETGYEQRDTNFWQLVRWFIGLEFTLIATLALVYVAYHQWQAWAHTTDALPSPLLSRTQVPPEPRILPNPVDSGPTFDRVPFSILQSAPESLPAHREEERKKQEELGLIDPVTGKPALPEDAVRKVLQAEGGSSAPAPRPADAGGAAPPETRYEMPSDPSGGTRTEDLLR